MKSATLAVNIYLRRVADVQVPHALLVNLTWCGSQNRRSQCHSLGLATSIGYVPHLALIYPELRHWFSLKKNFFSPHVAGPKQEFLIRHSCSRDMFISNFDTWLSSTLLPFPSQSRPELPFFFFLAKSDTYVKNYY